jgi:hypothetical protein
VGRVADLKETIDRIRDSPRLFPTVYRDVRRAVYFDESDTVYILAVSHQKRDPEQTRRRII